MDHPVNTLRYKKKKKKGNALVHYKFKFRVVYGNAKPLLKACKQTTINKINNCDLSRRHRNAHCSSSDIKTQQLLAFIFGLVPWIHSPQPCHQDKQDPWLDSGVYRSGFSLVDHFNLSPLEGLSILGWKLLLTRDQISWRQRNWPQIRS